MCDNLNIRSSATLDWNHKITGRKKKLAKTDSQKKTQCPEQMLSPVNFSNHVCVCEQRQTGRVGGGYTDNTFFPRCVHGSRCGILPRPASVLHHCRWWYVYNIYINWDCGFIPISETHSHIGSYVWQLLWLDRVSIPQILSIINQQPRFTFPRCEEIFFNEDLSRKKLCLTGGLRWTAGALVLHGCLSVIPGLTRSNLRADESQLVFLSLFQEQ